MKFSQQRADAVREFLVKQGMSSDTVTAVGMGKDCPVADNSTNGRAQAESPRRNHRLRRSDWSDDRLSHSDLVRLNSCLVAYSEKSRHGPERGSGRLSDSAWKSH